MTITKSQLAEWRRLADAATPGEWWVLDTRPDGKVWVDARGVAVADCEIEANADFIAAARSAIPALLDEIERLRGSHCPHCEHDPDEHFCVGVE